MPPSKPGMMIDSFKLGAAKAPWDPARLNRRVVASFAPSDMFETSASVYVWGVNGGGLRGNGLSGPSGLFGQFGLRDRDFVDRRVIVVLLLSALTYPTRYE